MPSLRLRLYLEPAMASVKNMYFPLHRESPLVSEATSESADHAVTGAAGSLKVRQ
jgi:hypothetical protein